MASEQTKIVAHYKNRARQTNEAKLLHRTAKDDQTIFHPVRYGGKKKKDDKQMQ